MTAVLDKRFFNSQNPISEATAVFTFAPSYAVFVYTVLLTAKLMSFLSRRDLAE
jgi:hypothetical protein